ncbi:MAG: type II toxin-antitoxin system HicB family antitoxin [Candidatus Kapaibacterium sp.]
MLTSYIEAAMRHATYEVLPDDHSYYGEIPECEGVWANGPTRTACESDLRGALEAWLLFSLERQLPIPVINGIELRMKQAA